MGLGNSSNRAVFVSQLKGDFVVKVKEGTEGAESRTNKNGVVVHELKYNELSGLLTNIYFNDGKFGKEFRMHITDSGIDYILTLSAKAIGTGIIMRRIQNIDFNQPITLQAAVLKGDDGKERNMTFIKQNGESIEEKISKDDVPALEEVVIDGEKRYSHTNRIEFYTKLAEEVNKNVIQAKPKSTPNIADVATGEETTQEESDDLPF